MERCVATHAGDEFPKMRDDLIRRKNNDEGLIERHYNAWMTIENWELHWNDDDSDDSTHKKDPS